MRIIKIVIFGLVFSAFVACSSDEDTNNLTINFINNVGDESVVLGQQSYNKNGGESFSIDELKYIISNIVLIDSNGNEFVYPQEDSYFLINEEVSSSMRINLQNIDARQYTSIRFGVGVDQSNYPLNGVDNFVPTAQESGMLWSWSAGYIFIKVEGLYNSNTQTDKPFRFHVGSHGENLDNYREVGLNFLQPLALYTNKEVSIEFDVLKMFSGQNELLLENKDDIQIDPENAPKIVDNVSQAFEIILN